MRTKAALAVLSGVACLASVAATADAATAAPAGQTARQTAGQTAGGCDPSWHLVTAPPAPGPINNILTNIDVVSSKDAWFTGFSYPYAVRSDSENPPVIMMFRWNGKAISSVPSPATSYAPDLGTGVGADLTLDSPTDGWLGAGSTIGGSPAVRLNDGRWTPEPTAPDSAADGQSTVALSDAVSISASDAWAVGGYGVSGLGQGIAESALIEHWNGTQWTIATTPPPPDPDSQLLALTAISPSDIWAIGWQGSNSYTDTIPLVEHFNGAAWHLVSAPAPGPSGTSAYPAAISGTGPDDVWMAGTVSPNGVGGIGTGSTSFVERWNGTAWSVATASLPPGAIGSHSLYAASPTEVWAAQTSGQGIGTSFLHFDGHSWTTVPFPGPQEYGVRYTYYAISGSGAEDIWAVGTETTGDVPLIAHLSCGQGEGA